MTSSILNVFELFCCAKSEEDAFCISDFQSVTGYFAVGSLVVLPAWLFALHKDLVTYLSVPLLVQHIVTIVLIAGRCLCMFVEVIVVYFSTILARFLLQCIAFFYSFVVIYYAAKVFHKRFAMVYR